ncbi:helix-turn-helix transcriptional regulator [Hyphococcus flavus]|uniref:Helix-turn-helix transcriptional regulator n=1 Tax=Hyphococcus flavus TaxID=1866326 RepID=A0AAE9ZLM5_9PROT|nr:helix-turn-helix transcriptional regulator [Hyphococcus flavus]WDI32970.1 helix-turn-helix transcriptional regulator [Hyphococcus flavus]
MANNLKELRIALLLSPRELARLIGIYPEYISRLESQDRPIGELWAEAITKALGVPAYALTDSEVDIAAIAARAKPRVERPPVLCPIAARYAIMALVAKMGGLWRAEAIEEDDIADAVQNLVAYVDDETPNLPGEKAGEVRASRLLRGLQISALTILQYHEADLTPDFQNQLEIAVLGAVQLLEAFSSVDETVQLPGI